jgi:hypothetical protein
MLRALAFHATLILIYPRPVVARGVEPHMLEHAHNKAYVRICFMPHTCTWYLMSRSYRNGESRIQVSLFCRRAS